MPFCHAVYQERLRKEVKKMMAVATVPFLSLISFQRRLSSARLSVETPQLSLPPFSLCLQGVDAGVRADIWGRHTLGSYGLLNRSVNTDLGGGRGEGSDVPSLGAPFVVDIRSAFAVSACTIIRRPVTNPLLSVTRYQTWVV